MGGHDRDARFSTLAMEEQSVDRALELAAWGLRARRPASGSARGRAIDI